MSPQESGGSWGCLATRTRLANFNWIRLYEAISDKKKFRFLDQGGLEDKSVYIAKSLPHCKDPSYEADFLPQTWVKTIYLIRMLARYIWSIAPYDKMGALSSHCGDSWEREYIRVYINPVWHQLQTVSAIKSLRPIKTSRTGRQYKD